MAGKQDAPKRGTHKPDIDWVKVMVHVRAGLRSYDDIGAEFNVSKGRISQKAKELGVTKDLAPSIRARADAKVQAAEARKTARKRADDVNAPRKRLVESEVVENGAVLMANTILAERAVVKRLLALAEGLTDELEGQAVAVKQLASRKARATTKEDAEAQGVRIEPATTRIEALRKLSETTKTLIVLERAVFNIAPDTPIDPTARVAEALDSGFEGLRAAFDKRLGRAPAAA